MWGCRSSNIYIYSRRHSSMQIYLQKPVRRSVKLQGELSADLKPRLCFQQWHDPRQPGRWLALNEHYCRSDSLGA